MDPFATLALAPRFDLDPARIQSAYLQAVGSAHPDASASAASGGGGPAPARPDPAAINEARRILADPERRADALLRRLGGPPSAQERGLPEGFLMEVMEVRQQIEADLAADPAAAAARSRWEVWAEQRRAERQQAVAAMFQALGDPPAPEALRDIRIQLNAWRYIERLIEQLDPEYDPAVADFDH